MAIILGEITISGRIGNRIYSHNSGGPYIKKFSVPTNPNSVRQQAVRAQLSTNSKAWSLLTSPQRSAWDVFASTFTHVDRLGQPKPLTGPQVYNLINGKLLQAGITPISDPPATVVPPSLLTMSAARTTATSATVSYTATPLAAQDKLHVWMTLPANGARRDNFNQARVIGFSGIAAASPQTFTLPFSWAVGQTVTFFVSVMRSNGMESPPLMFRVVGV